MYIIDVLIFLIIAGVGASIVPLARFADRRDARRAVDDRRRLMTWIDH